MTPKQEQALAALLSNPDRKTAAKSIGISDRTLRTYFQDPEFSEAYRQAYNEILQDAVAEGKQLLHLSMETFKEIMKNGSPDASRVSAAKAALEGTLKLTEQIDILAQIEELKKAVFSDDG